MAVKSLSDVLGGVTRFGRLTVIAEAPRRVSPSGYAAKMALVRCDCGEEKAVSASALRHKATSSCGCLQRETAAIRTGARTTSHGHARKGAQTTEYVIWKTMRARCFNPKHDSYPSYGGRGVTVCSRWNSSFGAFLADMGLRPSKGHSIDRIESTGHYEPGNCRWATSAEQAANRRPMRPRVKKEVTTHD